VILHDIPSDGNLVLNPTKVVCVLLLDLCQRSLPVAILTKGAFHDSDINHTSAKLSSLLVQSSRSASSLDDRLECVVRVS
jgi:hypothetical protein